uniref:Uncharacterized protein n=1 Tax=Lactuca sativa TaxID=4236 RepID=A0A9R1ULQ4_LACSA|nr:hypothetical protein LSAT_V11C800404360 [Lactuca sativa]
MTPTEIIELIEMLAIKSKHSGNEDEGVKEVSTVHLEAQISELTKAILLLTKEKVATKKQCGVCLKTDHPIDVCPILQEDRVAFKAVGGYQQNFQNNYQFQQHRNFQQPGFQQNFQNQQNFQHQNFQQPLQHQSISSIVALEDIVKSLAISTQAFYAETRASIKNLDLKESYQGIQKKNPKHNVSDIYLRSRKTYEGPSSSEP